MSHLDWLQKNFARFLSNLAVENPEDYMGLISAHGDKCYSYRDEWEPDIPFDHGVAIYLLSYIHPYSKTVRQTKDGWRKPAEWVKEQYPVMSKYLPPARCKTCRDSTWDNPCSLCKPYEKI